MSDELWNSVEAYLCEALVQSDPALTAALASSESAGLPPISVSPNEGKLLHLLARLHRARRILEIGTLGGYSTIWLARALPKDGLLISLELEPSHAAVARRNIEVAGLSHLVEIRVGIALEALAQLHAQDSNPFDLIFVDADKPNNPHYLEWALKLSRPGSLIIVDNVVRDGAVVDAGDPDPSVQGVRSMLELVSREPRLCATALQTVGSKGYDGFMLALVIDPTDVSPDTRHG